MFSIFTGLSLKFWLLTGVAVVAMGVFAKYEYTLHQLNVAKSTIVNQEVQIAVQKDTIVTDQHVAVIEEKTQVATQVAVANVALKHADIQKTLDRAQIDIEQHYDALPVTVENADKEQLQFSEIRINALWEAYCASSPDALNCPIPPPSGV